MRIPFWFGLIHIGRPTGIGAYRYDVSATLYLWPRGDVPHGEYAWHRIWRISWNWLPDRVYKQIGAVAILPAWNDRLKATISGKSAAPQDGSLLPAEYAGAFDSSRWTGRERRLVGFGIWQREYWHHRSHQRSKMYVYLTGSKERSNAVHNMYIAPGALGKRADCPNDWYEIGVLGTEVPKQMTIVFHQGRAQVEKNIGELMIAHGMAQRTNIIKRSGAVLGNLASAIAGR